MSAWRLAWPRARGGVAGSGLLRATNSDFRVDEILAEPLAGEGDHLCLYVQKNGDNTEYVARQIAQLLGLKPVDIGYCGLKDRHAITGQWFSLHLPKADDEAVAEKVSAQWPVLEYSRHPRKLRRGEHRANRFVLVVRDISVDGYAVESRLTSVARNGFPNYYGPQRFGHDGNNLDQAMRLDPRRLRGRLGKRAMYLSAARAWLFNEILGGRVGNGSWRERLEGDPDPDQPTAALLGDGGSSAAEPLKTEEEAYLAAHPHFAALLETTRTRPERRPTCVVPEAMTWEWLDGQALELAFALPSGCFATSLLAEILETSSAVPGASRGTPADSEANRT